jgi:hypothetical protein
MRDLHQLQKHIASLERSIDKAIAELGKLQKLRREGANDENEPNSDPEPSNDVNVSDASDASDVSAAANTEIAKTNPIPELISGGPASAGRHIAAEDAAVEKPNLTPQIEPNSQSIQPDHGLCVAGTSTAPGSIPRLGSLGHRTRWYVNAAKVAPMIGPTQ